MCGCVRKFVTFSIIFWTICLLVFSSKCYRQIVGISIGTNSDPLVADFVLFCYISGFMLSLSENIQTHVIGAFNSTSRYQDDLLNIDNPYFEQMVRQIHRLELSAQ